MTKKRLRAEKLIKKDKRETIGFIMDKGEMNSQKGSETIQGGIS